MKKLNLIIFFHAIAYISYAQTNTFPSSGYVGVGTTSPTRQLEIISGPGIGPLKVSGPNGYLLIDNVGSGQSYYQANSFHQFQGSSGAPLMTILNSGNVGIGTTSPSAPLDFGSANYIKQLIYGSGGDTGYYMGLGVNLGSAPNTFTAFIGPPGGDGSHGDGSFSIASATTTWPYTAYTTRFAVLSSGNVGIGTTNPTNALSVTTSNNGDEVNITNSGSGNAVIDYFTSNGGQSYIGQVNGTWGGSLTNPSVFESNKNIAITPVLNDPSMGISLLTNGNIGIGTTTPDQKLAVNGTIHSKAVLVDLTGWSDYVFKQGYTLLSLSEVKSYIAQNHHLPDMPPEQEVIKDGINLGEMNKLLTKKVEELTLYLIQQKEETDKRLQSQQQEIEELKQLLKK